MRSVRKKRWSLVRFLASCVPNFLWEYLFPVPPRMYISTNIIQKLSALKQNKSPLDESNTSFCTSFKPFIYNTNHHFLNSTPKKNEEVEASEIKALQKELLEIKKIVGKIMEHHCEQSSGYGTSSNPTDQLQKSFVAPPPPPPPPPLPPSNFSLAPVPKTFIKEEKKKNLGLPPNGFPCGKELLKDLKKIKLKKVEKSPGGGPIKKPKKTINDPGDFLESILKKRFGCVQNSPESSLDSPLTSFETGTQSNSYDSEKNLQTVFT